MTVQDRFHEVVTMRDARGMSFVEIGIALGITKQRAHQLYLKGKRPPKGKGKGPLPGQMPFDLFQKVEALRKEGLHWTHIAKKLGISYYYLSTRYPIHEHPRPLPKKKKCPYCRNTYDIGVFKGRGYCPDCVSQYAKDKRQLLKDFPVAKKTPA